MTSIGLDLIEFPPDSGSWEEVLKELPIIFTSLEQMDITRLVSYPDGEDSCYMLERTEHFRHFSVIISGLKDQGKEPHLCFIENACQHYVRGMEAFLLNQTAGAPPSFINQAEYIIAHNEDCDWCPKHASEWKQQKSAVRKRRRTSMEAMGVRGAPTLDNSRRPQPGQPRRFYHI